MMRRWWMMAWCVGALVVVGAGCQYLPFGAQTSDSEDEFADLDEPETSTDAALDADPHAHTLGDLGLKLTVGQRFPLRKTVEQRVTQALPGGTLVGRSWLELLLSLEVEQVRQADRLIAVRYHRVRFHQDLGGAVVDYNSADSSAAIPTEALPYAGLQDNGFSFWLGADNQVRQLVGFQPFLERCLQRVPADQRPFVQRQLLAMRTEDGLANFVDDSIGLLPHPSDPKLQQQQLRIGSSWEQQTRPSGGGGAETAASTRCILKDLSPTSAEISLIGGIAPASYVDELQNLKLTIKGGQLTGSCTVDRTTGMPTKSRVERALELTAQLPDGSEIEQQKLVVTTIVAYLEQGAAPAAAALDPLDRGVRPAVHAELESAAGAAPAPPAALSNLLPSR